MGRDEIARRVLQTRARVSSHLIAEQGPSDAAWPRVVMAAESIRGTRLWIDDRAATAAEIGLTARAVAAKAGHLALIVIDYLQLMVPDVRAGSREQDVTEMSRACKRLAQELQSPVLLLSQFSRAFEHQRRLPALADLRESGAIEQDANNVLLLYRPEDDTDLDARPDGSYRVWSRVAKGRNSGFSAWRRGEAGTRCLRFVPQFCTFTEEWV